jgi:hypothetical protein
MEPTSTNVNLVLILAYWVGITKSCKPRAHLSILEMLRAQRLRTFSLVDIKNLLHMLCSLKSTFTFELSTWELQLIIGLPTLRWHLDGSHVEQLQQALSHSWQAFGQSPKLPTWVWIIFFGPMPSVFQTFFGLSWMFLCSVISPLLSHFKHGHITHAQTVESLKIGWALNNLSFGWKLVNSEYQTPKNCKLRVALNSSLSVKGTL